RAMQSGLVRRRNATSDRRLVIVSLTPRGKQILSRLTLLHKEEMKRVRAGFPTPKLQQPPSTEHES
ncbi:MAG: hypothetical protein WA180_11745, partial [Candidatus Sulfotelmatobacter sp.]